MNILQDAYKIVGAPAAIIFLLGVGMMGLMMCQGVENNHRRLRFEKCFESIHDVDKCEKVYLHGRSK